MHVARRVIFAPERRRRRRASPPGLYSGGRPGAL